MGGAMKYSQKKLLGHEVFRSIFSWATKFYSEKFVKPSGPAPPSYILNVRSLMEDNHQMFIKYHNFLVYRSSLKEKVPVNTRNTTPNTFSISFFVVPHLPLVS